MKCSGKYTFQRDEHICYDRWGCKHFSIRAKPKRETPKSKTEECEHYKPTGIETT